jgi:hypothetical protein
MNARITITFVISDFQEYADDYMDKGTTPRDAANEALVDLLREEGTYNVLDLADEATTVWNIEYPAPEAAE